ncbi:methyl-accepting chemotaxis protein [Fulvimarina endophytica]|uniref:Methyl-accepting chemotaxis protein n=1 Tax=Fulvimarina endophytica TaxID=2293836 RepID=A0A371WXQ7_9HYPH|nr:methyl-accepting chemotaxis protein [Fulvimarina endophytica]
MRISNIGLGKKIGASFLAMVVGAAAMGGAVYYQMSGSEQTRLEYRQTNLQIRETLMMRALVARQELSLRGYLLYPDPSYVQNLRDYYASFQQEASKLRELTSDPALLERLDTIDTGMTTWRQQILDEAIRLAGSPDTMSQAVALTRSPAANALINPLEADIDGLTAALLERAEGYSRFQNDAYQAGLTKMLLGVGLLLLLGGLLGWALTRNISAPIVRLRDTMADLLAGNRDIDVPSLGRGDEVGQMAGAVDRFRLAAIEQVRLESEAVSLRSEQDAERDRIAVADRRMQSDLQQFVDSIETGFGYLSQGDLTVRMERPVAAQYEPIREQFNETVGKLEATFGSVVSSIGSIRMGLGEINVASNDLAQRTEQQAASLEETVAALAEVTRAVNETAQDAGRAQESAESANKNAAKGGEIVGKAVEAMRGIEQSSEKIGKIIGVIDEIAFQTNLLALNAGVEAARAGEAGRGFAVVAQEVRGLSQRSAEAAKEIKDLVSTSSAQVEAGVEFVSASGRSLDEIIIEVSNVSRNVAEIARRAREQAVSLKEVSTAADQMDKVTQQNAAMVGQATAAAQSLSAETDELGRLIAEFKLASAGGQATIASRNAARSSAAAPTAKSRPVVQMRPTAQGNAALKALEDNWEEF